jgi:hypothetical protein
LTAQHIYPIKSTKVRLNRVNTSAQALSGISDPHLHLNVGFVQCMKDKSLSEINTPSKKYISKNMNNTLKALLS